MLLDPSSKFFVGSVYSSSAMPDNGPETFPWATSSTLVHPLDWAKEDVKLLTASEDAYREAEHHEQAQDVGSGEGLALVKLN
jgi:hypothetical protein